MGEKTFDFFSIPPGNYPEKSGSIRRNVLEDYILLSTESRNKNRLDYLLISPESHWQNGINILFEELKISHS